MNYRVWLAPLLWVFVGSGLGIYGHDLYLDRLSRRNVKAIGYDPSDYGRIWSDLKRRHVRTDITDAELFYGSLNGLAEGTGDPHTRVLTPAEAAFSSSWMEGSFSGIGAVLESGEPGTVIVKEVYEDSPAGRAGLQQDETVTAIDGAPIGQNAPLHETVLRIRGEKGSTVRLTVRGADGTSRELAIVRGDVHLPPSVTVKTVERNGKTIDVIRITGFDKPAADLFETAALDAAAKRRDGVILDLRGNPGGLVDVAQSIACRWIADAPMLIEADRDGNQKTLRCGDTALLRKAPTAVLVDGNSASASEIVAGALQDYGLARVIGEKTYGKGSVQLLLNHYASKIQLNVTVYLWMTPKGRSINITGITPDETVEGADAQMERAVEFLTNGR